MKERKNGRRRRRRPQSLLAYLLPMLAILLVGVLMAAALAAPAPVRPDAAADVQASQLADRLAGSVEPEQGQGNSLPVPAQKGTVPVRNPEA